MANLVADGEMLARLRSLDDRSTTMIVDSTGKMVGLFTPAAHPVLRSPLSDEESLARARDSERGITTAELLAMLEKKK